MPEHPRSLGCAAVTERATPSRQHELYRALRLWVGWSATELAAEIAAELSLALPAMDDDITPVKQPFMWQIEQGADARNGRGIPEDPPIPHDKTRADVAEPWDFDWDALDEPVRICRFGFDLALLDAPDFDRDPDDRDATNVYAVVRLVDPEPTKGGPSPFEQLDPPVAFPDNLAGRDAADAAALRHGPDAVVWRSPTASPMKRHGR